MRKLRVYTNTFLADTITPITIFRRYVGKKPGFLLESKEAGKGRYSFIGLKGNMEVKSYGNDYEVIRDGVSEKGSGKVLEVVKELISETEVINESDIPFVGGGVGSISYDTIKQYEYIEQLNEDEIKTPDVHLMFTNEVIVYDHLYQTVYLVSLQEDNEEGKKQADIEIQKVKDILKKPFTQEYMKTEENISFRSNVTEEEFKKMVETAKDYIKAGDIFQVVLSQRYTAECKTDPLMLYRRLKRVNPSPYLVFFQFDDYHIVGASPEMLVEVKDGLVYNCPIAGTRKRGNNSSEDKELAADLLADEKERAEHAMLVDLGRNDMGRISEIGSVEVVDYMQVKYYSHVMHLVSLVRGNKREDKDMFDCLMSFLPAGTLSGAPKIRAMEIIEELEKVKRGIYGGALGYFGYNGNMDMCIAIRTMVVKDEKVYMQAGAGIVLDSDPESEYYETKNKVEALIHAVSDNEEVLL